MRPDVAHAVALGEDDLVVIHDGDGDPRNAGALHLSADQPIDLGQGRIDLLPSDASHCAAAICPAGG